MNIWVPVLYKLHSEVMKAVLMMATMTALTGKLSYFLT